VFFKWAMAEPENISIDTNFPIQARQGEELVLEVQIENSADQVQQLYSIDIDSSYLFGIAITEASPPYYESYTIPVVDMETYTFEHDIPAGETLVVQFSGLALKGGDFSGAMDVCINSSNSCSSFSVRTVIAD